jgi:hypothetical protein
MMCNVKHSPFSDLKESDMLEEVVKRNGLYTGTGKDKENCPMLIFREREIRQIKKSYK